MKTRRKLLFTLALVTPPLAMIVTLSRSPAPPLDYRDTWRSNGPGPGGYLLEGFNGEVVDGLGGFVHWQNNAQGFRHSTPTAPVAGGPRILSMGDSFAAGYRVDQEATYSRLLEVALGCDVPIACVEHPAFGLEWLRRYGATWHPDVVLYGLCTGNDLAQVGAAAGVRIRSCRLPTAAMADPTRPRSQTCDSGPGLGVFLRSPPAEVVACYSATTTCLLQLDEAARAIGAKLVVLVIPMRFQLNESELAVACRVANVRTDAVDVDHEASLVARLRERGLVVVDPVETFRAHASEDLYLPAGDMHWTARGHALAAEALLSRTAGLLPRP